MLCAFIDKTYDFIYRRPPCPAVITTQQYCINLSTTSLFKCIKCSVETRLKVCASVRFQRFNAWAVVSCFHSLQGDWGGGFDGFWISVELPIGPSAMTAGRLTVESSLPNNTMGKCRMRFKFMLRPIPTRKYWANIWADIESHAFSGHTQNLTLEHNAITIS